uniref:Uncharacterized protein n=1 Tax=Candidatus Kentrum sp. FW TaxID=2126338 RepID=A0A450SM70_9GAMM|nr:MAG: hypothetical protein BECKFW1821B_GA0114236_102030 [Candidatus Kentron sp. FW]
MRDIFYSHFEGWNKKPATENRNPDPYDLIKIVYFPLGFASRSSFNGALLMRDHGLIGLRRGLARIFCLFSARLCKQIKF